jgi:uncharacterized membrane protein YdjX (TVP38/TMEM64 family)
VHHFQHLSYFNEYIRSFGYLAPAVALILFIIQAAIPIFPYAVLVAASVILFGARNGFLLAMVGALLGSIVCYWVVLQFGAQWFNQKILGRWGYDTNDIRSGIAFWGIVISHLVPVLPSSMIASAAALSRVSLGNFVAATALGLVPATLAYTGLGLFLFHVKDVHKALWALAAILLILFLCKNTVKKKLSLKIKTLDS